jgi:3-oxoacyl-[acyl-carrier protein] reductase
MYALVTGASRGIGAAIATRLAADGYDIVVNFRANQAAAGSVAAAIRAHGREADLLPLDVTDRAAARSAMDDLVARRGAPDALVINAGITRDGLLCFMKDEDWDAVIAGGLGGFYNIVRPLIGPMLRARRGRIVTLASLTGQAGNAGQVNYAAAKGGLIAASKSLAREVGKRGLTVNTVAPGLIDTDMTAELPLDQMLPLVPAGRIGSPEEVAGAVAYFCSPVAAYVTGQVLGVNGGLYM